MPRKPRMIHPGYYHVKTKGSGTFYKNEGETMDEKTKESLFKPFFTTKKDGSGLGLFSIYKIVYLSGGYIEFKSEDKKTQFCLYIPTEEHAS